MSLIDELAGTGVSTEDLEKAASIAIFEKVAAADGIDFNELDDNQVEELFQYFLTDVLPDMSNEEQAVEEEAINPEKAASAILFEKMAEEEDIDLDSLTDEQLQELYTHFLDNVIPSMTEEQPAQKQASAEEVEEAQAKLAEAEILGRYMARSFMDELNGAEKQAGVGTSLHNLMHNLKGGGVSRAAKAVASHNPGTSASGQKALGGALKKTIRANRAAGASAGALGTASLAAGAYGLKKLHDKKKAKKDESKEASAVLFDKLAEERANEILEANGVGQEESELSFDDMVTLRAVEMLQGAGYTFEE